MLSFKLYNTKISSFLDLSIFGIEKSSFNEADVTIELSEIPIKRKFNKDSHSIGDSYSYFSTKNLGLFEVTNGQLIRFSPVGKYNELDVIESVLGFPMALCMSQRGHLVMHSSCVQYKGKNLLFCGASHAGKSTIAAFLSSKGGDIVSEDISVIDNSSTILPSGPYIKISRESLNETNINAEFLKNSTRSRHVFKTQQLPNLKKSAEICIFLKWGARTELKSISLKHALDNLYSYCYLSSSSEDSKKIINFISNIKFYELRIVKNFEKIEEVLNKIENI